MDTLYCRHRWLLWTVLIVLLNQCWEVSGSFRECPQGQLMHSLTPYVTCCYPTRCGVGEHVKRCSINGTHDTCQMCGSYYNQSLRTSSFTMEPCTPWPLDKECKNIYNPTNERNIKDEQTRRCMCNIELGKMFSPPETQFPGAPMDSYCQRRMTPCQPGHEPVVDGGCRPCRENYFQADEGFRLCEPTTNCSKLGLNYVFLADPTHDNICSEPDLITTPQPYVPVTSVPVTASKKPPVVSSQSTPSESTTTPDTGRIGLSRDLGTDDNNLTWPVVGGVVLFLVILVVFIALVMFWRKRKGMSVWVCASTKNYSDPEKNYTQGSSSMHVGPRGKHGMGDVCVIPQHLTTDGDKIINNNISGGVPCGLGYLPNGHPNGNVHHAHFNQTEHGNSGVRSFYPNPVPYHLVPTSRPGILRNVNHNVVYGQSQGNVQDRSIDSIGQEKLQVHVDELEANLELGENDPLLVPDHLRGVPPLQIQNLGASVGNSPPVMQAGVNPLHVLAYNGPGVTNFGAAFVHSGAASPPVQPNAAVVTYAPATGTVTFTRSTSVIASPEGEVDEDEIEARLPRLSQLLTEGENSSVIESNHNARDFFRADSPGRETTQQLRAPSQRLIKDQYHSPRNGNPINQQPRVQGNNPTQQRPGFSPAVVGPVPQRGPQHNQPDHHIMNLKEQQLAESFHSTFNKPTSDLQPKYEPDLSATDAPKTVVSYPEEAQQTELKTHLLPAAESDFSTAAGAKQKTTKIGQDITQTTEPKEVDFGGDDNNMMNRKRQVSGGSSGQSTLEKKSVLGGTNFQNVSDRKRVPSGGSNSSGQSTLECQRVDQQRPCIKNSSEEGDNTAKKPHRYNRTVSFEEEESPQPSNRVRGPSTEPRQSAKSSDSPDKATIKSKYRGPLRSISDPEQKVTHQIESDDEETERKCVSLEYNASDGSSKTSVNSDVSGADSSSGSPCRTALYRSQSENAPCSSDSAPKPPPRSMSEEKPQKLDRPIAKVKPMPASDNAVNQLPFEVSEDTGAAPQLSVPASNNAAAILGHNSDESDHEDSSEGNHSAMEEEDENREAGENVEEDGV